MTQEGQFCFVREWIGFSGHCFGLLRWTLRGVSFHGSIRRRLCDLIEIGIVIEGVVIIAGSLLLGTWIWSLVGHWHGMIYKLLKVAIGKPRELRRR